MEFVFFGGGEITFSLKGSQPVGNLTLLSGISAISVWPQRRLMLSTWHQHKVLASRALITIWMSFQIFAKKKHFIFPAWSSVVKTYTSLHFPVWWRLKTQKSLRTKRNRRHHCLIQWVSDVSKVNSFVKKYFALQPIFLELTQAWWKAGDNAGSAFCGWKRVDKVRPRRVVD